MGPVLPLHPLVIHQTYIGFIDQSGRLDAVVLALSSHVAVRQAVKFRIDDRRQLVEGELVSVAPGAEQLTDIVQEPPPGSMTGSSFVGLYCPLPI
jgi:hypothetical protein